MDCGPVEGAREASPGLNLTTRARGITGFYFLLLLILPNQENPGSIISLITVQVPSTNRHLFKSPNHPPFLLSLISLLASLCSFVPSRLCGPKFSVFLRVPVPPWFPSPRPRRLCVKHARSAPTISPRKTYRTWHHHHDPHGHRKDRHRGAAFWNGRPQPFR